MLSGFCIAGSIAEGEEEGPIDVEEFDILEGFKVFLMTPLLPTPPLFPPPPPLPPIIADGGDGDGDDRDLNELESLLLRLLLKSDFPFDALGVVVVVVGVIDGLAATAGDLKVDEVVAQASVGFG